jgi:hypothetical protein
MCASPFFAEEHGKALAKKEAYTGGEIRDFSK